MSSERSRIGNRWTVNECLQLQREFELLNLSIDEIADRHRRTPNAIMNKLDREGFANYNVLYNNYYNLNNDIPIQGTNNYEKEEETEVDVEANLEDQEYVPEEDEDEDEDEEEDEEYDDIKAHIMRLEKQVLTLTEMVMKQTKNNKSVFSLFA
jgi:DNA-binding transcriptional regulator GbsR (MarR family)